MPRVEAIELQQHTGAYHALWMGGDDAAWELINAMDGVSAQQLATGLAAGAHGEGDAGEPMDWGEEDLQPHQQQQQEEEEEAVGDEAQVAEFGGAILPESAATADTQPSDWEEESGESASSSPRGLGAAAAGGGKGGAGGSYGRIEPGVLAMAVSGPYVATVDTLGECWGVGLPGD